MPSERTFKAPVAEYNNRLVFERFKYAEEAARRLTDKGYAWVMFRDDDRIEIESGQVDGVPYEDHFSVPQFAVLWNE